METMGDDFKLNVEGKSGDLISGFLYCCHQEPALINVFTAVAGVINSEEYQNQLKQYNTQGDA